MMKRAYETTRGGVAYNDDGPMAIAMLMEEPPTTKSLNPSSYIAMAM